MAFGLVIWRCLQARVSYACMSFGNFQLSAVRRVQTPRDYQSFDRLQDAQAAECRLYLIADKVSC
eukprot:1318957-Amphidinium_carterae.1